MSTSPVRDAGHSAGLSADVFAGGAVCWRRTGSLLEVLLIHRPKYNDWSWPKGKADPGETLPECAVREVEEETGYRIHLGLPLPSAEYTVGKGTKKYVAYWAARVDDPNEPRAFNPREVDKGEWMSVAKARTKLTSFADRAQLDKLEHAESTGSLEAWPLVVVRHGKAFPRAKWHETEHVRPLLAVGTRQAMALTGLLSSWEVKKIVSSPWKRCVATVKPYAASVAKSIKNVNALSEKACANDPEKTTKVVEKLLAKGKPTVLCTHRPVLPTILAALADHSPQGLAERLPQDDPYMSPGEILVAYVRPGPQPRIVDLQSFRPIDS